VVLDPWNNEKFVIAIAGFVWRMIFLSSRWKEGVPVAGRSQYIVLLVEGDSFWHETKAHKLPVFGLKLKPINYQFFGLKLKPICYQFLACI
jgi:hypothetical protein